MEDFLGDFEVTEPGNPYVPKPNAVLEKSFSFSVRIVNLYKWLFKNHKDILPIARQILRSGTSIGANAEEAVSAYSKKEFAAKLQISLKESRETDYWLRLLHTTGYLDNAMFNSLKDDNKELIRMLTTILKTTKQE
ncbi:four helix bundle protein [Larkinella terrae]|nr:four helix bundle protein [Larkinella terrae]